MAFNEEIQSQRSSREGSPQAKRIRSEDDSMNIEQQAKPTHVNEGTEEIIVDEEATTIEEETAIISTNENHFNFPKLTNIDEEKIAEEKQTPEVINIGDESSGESTPFINASLPRLNAIENEKEVDFGNRRRPPLRKPLSRRRKRREQVTTSGSVLQSPLVNKSNIIPFQGSISRKPLTPIWNMIQNFPKEISNDFAPFRQAMCNWEMAKIDDIQIPIIFRNSQRFVAYSIAHIKLLSKFPTNVNISQYIPQDVTLEIVQMNETEAWMLNFINTIMCNYELGMQIFQNGDNLVELNSLEMYYLYSKKHYLEDLLKIYDGAVPQEALTECKNLIGAILNLKKKILEDLKKINEQIKIKYRQSNLLHSYFPTMPPTNQMYLSI